jgi:hypothetical protein
MDYLWDWATSTFSSWGLAKIYITCALIGGGVMFLQFGLNLIGVGGDTDFDDVSDGLDLEDMGDPSMSVLSIRALAGFLTFFGLVGWIGTERGWGSLLTPLAAMAAGSSVMFFIAWIMRFFKKLSISGTIDPKNAIGKTATVYLRIPGDGAGRGKITVSIQGRSVEYVAVTKSKEIPTGALCRIVAMSSDDCFEVTHIESAE